MPDSVFVTANPATEVSADANYTRVNASVEALPGGAFAAVWTQEDWGTGQPETNDIFLQLFNADGTENGVPILVNTTTADEQFLPDIAVLSSGDIVVVWTDGSGADGDGNGVFMQRYSATGTPLGVETQVNTATAGDQADSKVFALSGGGYGVIWTEHVDNGVDFTSAIQYQQYTSTGATVGFEITIASENDDGDVSYSAPDVVQMNGGNLAISWTRFEFGNNAFAQLSFATAGGAYIAGPIDPQQVADDPLTLPQVQLVALGNGHVLAVWMKSVGTTGLFGVGYGEVYGRIYNGSGVAQGDEFAIVSGTLNRRFDLFAAPDGQGGAMVGFVEEADTVNERALLVQNVTDSGVAVGEPHWLNQNISGQARSGDLALLDTGDLIAVFQDSGPGALSDILTARIANGDDNRFSTSAENVTLGNGGEAVAALEGADTVNGGAGDDTIGGGSGADEITGGGGADCIEGGDGGDTIDGGPDADVILGQDGNDDLGGGIGDDEIDGGLGDDTINGGNDNDTLYGGYGADEIDGGQGDDSIYGYRNEFNDMGPDDPDRDIGISNTLFGGVGNDRIYGGEGNDVMDGGTGNDVIFGDDELDSPGDDTVIGSEGTDTYNGMGGVNTLDYSAMSGGVDVVMRKFPGTTNASGQATVPGFTHTFFYMDTVIGSAFDDTVLGDDEINRIEGGLGADMLTGGLGNDNLQGEGGADTLDGGEGVDIIDGGNDNDSMDGGAEGDVLRGQGGNDTMNGDGGTDDLSGGVGDDVMSGGADNDVMRGQGNGDTIDGDGGSDTIYGGSGNDSINGGTQNDDLFGQGNNDTIRGGDGNDTISGAAGADQLFGDAGSDSINGGSGGDLLDGGTGNDTLSGGTQADTFVFLIGYDLDRINGYEQGIDRLHLDETLWSATNPGLTAQQVIDTFGTLNGTGSILTLDFGGGDILEVQSGAGINDATLGADVTII